MTSRCPWNRAWCVELEPAPDDHFCRSEEVELSSGWSVTTTQDEDGADLYLADPDYLPPAALTGRLSIPDALDLIAALVNAVRVAQAQPNQTLTPHGSSA